MEVDPDQDWSRFRPRRGFAAQTRTAKGGKKKLLSSRKDLNSGYIKRVSPGRSFEKNLDYFEEQVFRRRERGVLDSTPSSWESFTFQHQQHPEICELFFFLNVCFTPARLHIEDAQNDDDLMGGLSCHERTINGLREI